MGRSRVSLSATDVLLRSRAAWTEPSPTHRGEPVRRAVSPARSKSVLVSCEPRSTCLPLDHDQPPPRISVRHRDAFDTVAAPLHGTPELPRMPAVEPQVLGWDGEQRSLTPAHSWAVSPIRRRATHSLRHLTWTVNGSACAATSSAVSLSPLGLASRSIPFAAKKASIACDRMAKLMF